MKPTKTEKLCLAEADYRPLFHEVHIVGTGAPLMINLLRQDIFLEAV